MSGEECNQGGENTKERRKRKKVRRRRRRRRRESQSSFSSYLDNQVRKVKCEVVVVEGVGEPLVTRSFKLAILSSPPLAS